MDKLVTVSLSKSDINGVSQIEQTHFFVVNLSYCLCAKCGDELSPVGQLGQSVR